jgi:hypothetical protein
MKLDQKPVRFGQRLQDLKDKVDLKQIQTHELRTILIEAVCPEVEKILNYRFANKNILLEALTHRSFKDTYNLSGCYEKLEVLGDAILDYIANSNLLKYTMFERYNIEERKHQ